MTFTYDDQASLEQIAKLNTLAKQVEEWERAASISRLASASKSLAVTLKHEYDLIQRRVDLMLVALKVAKSLSRRISQQTRIFYLRRLAFRPFRHLKLWFIQGLAGRATASLPVLGDFTWQLIVGRPPMAPPGVI